MRFLLLPPYIIEAISEISVLFHIMTTCWSPTYVSVWWYIFFI